jgi:hypothetical protein
MLTFDRLVLVFVVAISVLTEKAKCLRESGYGHHQSCSVTEQRLYPQNTFDIRTVMGMWYGVEIVQHDGRDDGRDEYYDYSGCPVIHITEVRHFHQCGKSPKWFKFLY